MNITITGASGFVGQNLSEYLKSEQHSIQKLSLRAENWKKNFPEAAEAVIHLAGKAHDTSHTSSEDEYFKVNRDLTLEVFDQFLQSSARDFFFFSSVKAVADTVKGVLIEDIIGHPLTPYGVSKFEAENMLLKQELPEGKRLFIIRPCMIHGPGNKGNLNLLYNVVKKGIPWPLASFHNERSFLSVDNLNYLVGQMLNKNDLPSGVYNFADDGFISTNKLIEIISASAGKSPKLWHISPKIIGGMAKIGDRLKLPLNTERLHKLTENYKVSNAKIKQALGIKNLPLSAEEGLARTILSFSSN